MVTQLWRCESQNSRRKEHSLVIGMRNEQTYSLILQSWGACLSHGHRVEPRRDNDNGNETGRNPEHGDA
jgi:hypothetical protein